MPGVWFSRMFHPVSTQHALTFVSPGACFLAYKYKYIHIYIYYTYGVKEKNHMRVNTVYI